jgi:hypothetical protein
MHLLILHESVYCLVLLGKESREKTFFDMIVVSWELIYSDRLITSETLMMADPFLCKQKSMQYITLNCQDKMRDMKKKNRQERI